MTSGTSNGGAAFELERRGAERVVAVDIYPESWFGFDAVKKLLGSRVQYVEASVYELGALLRQEFDIVLFWGVLYHLRHPLLALDNIRALLRGTAFLETAVCDAELEAGELGSARPVLSARRAARRPEQLVRPDRGRARRVVRLVGSRSDGRRRMAEGCSRALHAQTHTLEGRPGVRAPLLRAAARTAFVQAPSNGSGEAATLMNLMQATARAAAARSATSSGDRW